MCSLEWGAAPWLATHRWKDCMLVGGSWASGPGSGEAPGTAEHRPGPSPVHSSPQTSYGPCRGPTLKACTVLTPNVYSLGVTSGEGKGLCLGKVGRHRRWPSSPQTVRAEVLGSPQPALACLLDSEVPACPPRPRDAPVPPLHPELPCIPVVHPPSLAQTSCSLLTK